MTINVYWFFVDCVPGHEDNGARLVPPSRTLEKINKTPYLQGIVICMEAPLALTWGALGQSIVSPVWHISSSYGTGRAPYHHLAQLFSH